MPSTSPIPDYGATLSAPTAENTTSDPATAVPAAIAETSIPSDAAEGELVPDGEFKKDLGFWIILVSLGLVIWLAALDLSCIATALPTIVSDLRGTTSFVWVSGAFTLASTAILPLSGNLAQLFGRQRTLQGFILLFAVGSATAGAAQNMRTMIAGRTVQGLGAGGLLALSDIIVADLVPLRERGMYEAILACVWAFASAVGPPIGGALAQVGQWRWLFWMNLPLCVCAAGMVFWFLRLKRPPGSWKRKIRRVDWIGNTIVIGGATATILALTQGGIDHPWGSYQIIVPLVIGLVALCVFLLYEVLFVVGEPMVPLDLLANRTSLSGYAGCFVHGLASIVLVYYLPVYFQGAMLASPIRSSVQTLPATLVIAPCAVLTGVSVGLTNHYVTQNVAAWMLTIVGCGLLSTLTKDSSTAQWVGYQVLTSVGMGVLWISTEFPVLAPLPASKNAAALAFFNFLRSASNTFGMTIGAAVLQNELRSTLPAAFAQMFPEGVDLAYAAIPQVAGLAEPLRGQVQDAFSTSLSVLWKITAGICGLGLLTSIWMKQLKMNAHVDENWGREEKRDERMPLAPTNPENAP